MAQSLEQIIIPANNWEKNKYNLAFQNQKLFTPEGDLFQSALLGCDYDNDKVILSMWGLKDFKEQIKYAIGYFNNIMKLNEKEVVKCEMVLWDYNQCIYNESKDTHINVLVRESNGDFSQENLEKTKKAIVDTSEWVLKTQANLICCDIRSDPYKSMADKAIKSWVTIPFKLGDFVFGYAHITKNESVRIETKELYKALYLLKDVSRELMLFYKFLPKQS